jgi:hypothetical protein
LFLAVSETSPLYYLVPEKTDAGLVDAQKRAKELLDEPLYAAPLKGTGKQRFSR